MRTLIESEHNKETDELVITVRLPMHQNGTYTYDETMTWEVPALCVYINSKYCEYTLNYLMYLDYKDSLQATASILHFDTQKEAEEFAKKHKLLIEYSNY